MAVTAVAAVLRNPTGPYSVESVDLADPGPNELLVRVAAVGHCHSDLLPRAPLGIPLPIVPGHEGAGVVEVVGGEVEGFTIGDHVLLSYSSCGRCRACNRNQPYACESFGLLNLYGLPLDGIPRASAKRDGQGLGTRWFGQSSFATYSVVAARSAVKVDPELPLEVLAPLGCGIQTGAGSVFNVLRPGPGDTLAVWGVGAVGLAAVMAGAIAGCSQIIAIDLHRPRLELARELGATSTLDGSETDLVAKVTEATRGGADVSLDTTGVPAVILNAIEANRVPGAIGLVGVQQGDLAISAGTLASGKQLLGIIEGAAAPSDFLPRLIALWQAGRFPIEQLVATYPLPDIATAEADAVAGRVVKPVLVPS